PADQGRFRQSRAPANVAWRQLHDHMKADKDYQRRGPQLTFEFPKHRPARAGLARGTMLPAALVVLIAALAAPAHAAMTRDAAASVLSERHALVATRNSD